MPPSRTGQSFVFVHTRWVWWPAALIGAYFGFGLISASVIPHTNPPKEAGLIFGAVALWWATPAWILASRLPSAKPGTPAAWPGSRSLRRGLEFAPWLFALAWILWNLVRLLVFRQSFVMDFDNADLGFLVLFTIGPLSVLSLGVTTRNFLAKRGSNANMVWLTGAAIVGAASLWGISSDPDEGWLGLHILGSTVAVALILGIMTYRVLFSRGWRDARRTPPIPQFVPPSRD